MASAKARSPELQSLAKAQLARHRSLASPQARAQRDESRMAFHGLTPTASLRLLTHHFGSSLSKVSANPAASMARTGTVVRYLSDYRAIVRTRSGRLQVDTSSVPLRVLQGGASKQPVSLRLHDAGDAFVAVNPLQSVSVSRQLNGGVAVGSDGIRMVPQGSDVTGSLVSDQDVFFADIGSDEDAMVAPTINGAELSTVLRSQLSPEQIAYRVLLPAGATLSAVAGGAVVSRGSRTLARIPAPVARDTQGTDVPVSMAVLGDELVLNVAHRERSLDYPLVVDPEVLIIAENATVSTGGTYPEKEPCSAYVGNHTECGNFSGESSRSWEVAPLGPATTPPDFTAEFDDISFSASAPTTHPEDVRWIVRARCGSRPDALEITGGWANEPAPTNAATTATECETEGTRHVEIVIQAGQFELFSMGAKVPQVTVEGSLSVGAILVSESLPLTEEPGSELYGPDNEGEPTRPECLVGGSVNCAVGNHVVTQTDLEVGGRGPGLNLTRTYNSQLAAAQAHSKSKPGPFGYGWTGSYSANLMLGGGMAIVRQDNGSTVPFLEEKGGTYVPLSPLVEAKLAKEGSGYIYTLPDQTKLAFNSAGLLTSETDRNGNAVTVSYAEVECEEEEGGTDVVAHALDANGLAKPAEAPPPSSCKILRPTAITDPAGRQITFSYNHEALVESATGPLGHVVKYGYSSENLATVTEPGESRPAWQFEYSRPHQLTEETDALAHTTTTEYDHSHQVVAQTDPLGHKRTWEYASTESGPKTTITEPNGSETVVQFDSTTLPTATTRAYGTSLASTTTDEYDGVDNLIATTDPNGHETTYGYDSEGNRTSEKDPLGHTTKWTYDSTHDVTSATTPSGETTTVTREGHGNATKVSRPAPSGQTQATSYTYDSHGEVTSMTGPLGRTSTYTYDNQGDRTSETDPEGDRTASAYDEDSQLAATTSPRGNTTTIERDAQGRPVTVSEPLSQPIDSFHFQFGSAGSGAEQLNTPLAMATDPSGNVWVADRYNNRVDEFSPSGAFIQAIGWGVKKEGGKEYEVCTKATGCHAGVEGSGGGQFNDPRGIAVNPNTGNLYVSDAGNNRIEEFSATASFMRAFNSESSGRNLKSPNGLAIDSSGNVWVADSQNNRIVEFNESGGYESAFGSEGSGNGQLKSPQDVAIVRANLFVADWGNDRIEEFSTTGKYEGQFGGAGSADGDLSNPSRLAVDPLNGDLYVADSGNSRIDVFSPEGTFVTKFGSAGKGEGQFESLKSIAISSSGAIYTADAGNERVTAWVTVSPSETSSPVYDFQFGSAGSGAEQLNTPLAMATDPSGNLWVADRYNNRVDEFSPSGGFIEAIGWGVKKEGGKEYEVCTKATGCHAGIEGSGGGQFNDPRGIAINQNTGHIYVSDAGNNRIEEFSSTASYLGSFGTLGSGVGHLNT
ncbi:MAG: SMP-30/gluconolactonase/LRE family protein, partial [Isosphaeraceae bacterium]